MECQGNFGKESSESSIGPLDLSRGFGAGQNVKVPQDAQSTADKLGHLGGELRSVVRLNGGRQAKASHDFL